jgi:hypothetical protein
MTLSLFGLRLKIQKADPSGQPFKTITLMVIRYKMRRYRPITLTACCAGRSIDFLRLI